MLAVSVRQVDIDHGAWSSRRGEPHAEPPICTIKVPQVLASGDA